VEKFDLNWVVDMVVHALCLWVFWMKDGGYGVESSHVPIQIQFHFLFSFF